MKAVRVVSDELLGRAEEGIFKAKGDYFSISINNRFETKLNGPLRIDDMLKQKPEYWTDLSPFFITENEIFRAETGETSFGGFGFVLLKNKVQEDIIWYLQYGMPFNNPLGISIEDQTVKVLTDANYPNKTLWSIPIDRPESLRIELA